MSIDDIKEEIEELEDILANQEGLVNRTELENELEALRVDLESAYDGLIYEEAPAWIEPGFCNLVDMKTISEGGCASGAYMPAVTYHKALETMSEYGDEVFDYLESTLGGVPEPPKGSWAGMAVFYVSYAVEVFAHWAAGIEDWV